MYNEEQETNRFFREEYEIHLEPGSRLFVYTDGVAEVTDCFDKQFGTDRTLYALISRLLCGK